MRQSLLATFVAAATLISSPSFGEIRFGSISSGGPYLDDAASKPYEQLINERLLDIGIDPERSEFKVPATNIVRYICTPVQITRLPTSHPDEIKVSLAAAMPMANARTFCMPSQMALGPG